MEDISTCANEWLEMKLIAGTKRRFSEIVFIGPDLAAQMLKYNGSNRPCSQNVVRKYSKIMQEGRWILTSDGVSFGNKGILIDGQHRLNAVVDSGAVIKATVWFGCEQEEFAALGRGKTRTAGDDLAVMRMDNYIKRAAVASMIIRLEKKTTVMPDSGLVRLKAIELDVPAMRLSIAKGDHIRKFLGTSSAALAYYEIYNKTTRNISVLDEFWEKFSSGANLPPKSPILTAREILSNSHKRSLGHLNSRDRAIAGAALIILSWNAYARGVMLKNFSWTDPFSLPKVV